MRRFLPHVVSHLLWETLLAFVLMRRKSSSCEELIFLGDLDFFLHPLIEGCLSNYLLSCELVLLMAGIF